MANTTKSTADRAIDWIDDTLASEAFWVWLRIAFIALCFLVGSAIGLGACGCTPTRYPAHSQVTGASVVTLVAPRVLTDEDGVWLRVAFVPSCNAFAIARDGEVYLATAAHCLEIVHDELGSFTREAAQLGQTVRYLAPNGVGHGFARVTYLDLTGDRALAVATGGELVPLPQAAPPSVGAWVESISPYYQAVSTGSVIGEMGSGWYQTNQTIVFGWSGSPVLDHAGRVWGIVSKCPLAGTAELATQYGVGEGTCLPGAAIVTALP